MICNPLLNQTCLIKLRSKDIEHELVFYTYFLLKSIGPLPFLGRWLIKIEDRWKL